MWVRPRLLVMAGACGLAFCVVVLGAYVRLSDAGLSCPDWPGCYGSPVVPSSEAKVMVANATFPERPVDTAKAWKEMAHRYLAGALGLSVAFIAWRAWWRRRAETPSPLPFVLVALVFLQALLGMWTVTLLLKPIVVTAHLIGGMGTLALLWWMCVNEARHGARGNARPSRYQPYQTLVGVGVAVLVLQLFLGGWTSANYAAVACQEFPRCRGAWWPAMHLSEGFTLGRELGEGSKGAGALSVEALVAIHMVHRLGAVLTFLVVGGASIGLLIHRPTGVLRLAAISALALLCAQIALGISIVTMSRPLELASAHNASAALLLLAVLTQHHELSRGHRGDGGENVEGSAPRRNPQIRSRAARVGCGQPRGGSSWDVHEKGQSG